MLAITPGEPAGIGPDLVVAAAQQARDVEWVVFADAQMLKSRAAILGLPIKLLDTPTARAQCLTVVDMPLAATVVPGILETANAEGVITALDSAISHCLSGELNALVTGPMQKSVINEAGIAFSGHTEFLCEQSGVNEVVMMLVADRLRVALATTHLPLKAVAEAITEDLLTTKLAVLVAGLQSMFNIAEPRIIVAGLNPHAGESGHLGREELQIIQPFCDASRRDGLRVIGPLPADTLFTPKYLADADAVLAMYHDQGLPVLKYAGFGEAVNVTLGLPFIRTSVDHGTALDLAGSGSASLGSFHAALALASRLRVPTENVI